MNSWRATSSPWPRQPRTTAPSSSTAPGRPATQHDRGTKLPDYREIPFVREILLVSSTERRVELWRRDGPRRIVETFIGEAELRLGVIDAAIPLAALYEATAV